ncbi:MAG TPA: hypothetical protein VHN80_24615 [Kineosporiaceae bacterium]|nr:hypothetical protein [Kineosporiaceae bacterium]
MVTAKDTVTTDRQAALTAYGRAWTLTDEAAIRSQLERCWTERSTYVNPFTDTLCGIEGLIRLILDFPVMFPQATVRGTSVPDLHHDVARFSWRLRSSAPIRILGRDFGTSVDGQDYLQFDPDGRIRRVIAFFDVASTSTARASV